MRSLCKDPFRICFPIALALAIYACVLWISFALFGYGTYPGQSHTHYFVGGFLYFSIMGFLMTAVPRFTQTSFASPKELAFLVAIIAGVLLTLFFGSQQGFWFAIFAGWLMLFLFSIRRFWARAQNPPITFVFVGLGVLLGAFGSFLLGLNQSGFLLSPLLAKLARIFFFDAMVLSFIIGVGGRLIPGILGFQEIIKTQRNIYEKPKSFHKIIPKSIYCLVVLFISSLFLEGFGFPYAGYFIRALVVTYAAVFFWRIHKKPPKLTWHGCFVVLACWFIVLSSWALFFMSNHQIALKHLAYIGGYSLLTFLVASRVTLAHGQTGLGMENRIFPFAVFGSLLATAAATRTVADFIPSGYVRHLGFAALCFLMAALVWGSVFVPRMLKLRMLMEK